MWELQPYCITSKRISKVCCKEDFEANKDIMVSLNYTFCFRIQIERMAVMQSWIHYISMSFMLFLVVLKKCFLHVSVKETVASIFTPGGNFHDIKIY
jgi:hypothetical protein